MLSCSFRPIDWLIKRTFFAKKICNFDREWVPIRSYAQSCFCFVVHNYHKRSSTFPTFLYICCHFIQSFYFVKFKLESIQISLVPIMYIFNSDLFWVINCIKSLVTYIQFCLCLDLLSHLISFLSKLDLVQSRLVIKKCFAHIFMEYFFFLHPEISDMRILKQRFFSWLFFWSFFFNGWKAMWTDAVLKIRIFVKVLQFFEGIYDME